MKHDIPLYDGFLGVDTAHESAAKAVTALLLLVYVEV